MRALLSPPPYHIFYTFLSKTHTHTRTQNSPNTWRTNFFINNGWWCHTEPLEGIIITSTANEPMRTFLSSPLDFILRYHRHNRHCHHHLCRHLFNSRWWSAMSDKWMVGLDVSFAGPSYEYAVTSVLHRRNEQRVWKRKTKQKMEQHQQQKRQILKKKSFNIHLVRFFHLLTSLMLQRGSRHLQSGVIFDRY